MTGSSPDPARHSLWWLPNALTLFRCVAGIGVAALLWAGWPAAAFGLFVLAALTDAADGILARRWSAQTPLGRALDPIADKLLFAGTALGLATVADATDILTIVFLASAGLIVLRDVFVSGIREFAALDGRMLASTFAAKLKTTVALLAAGAGLIAWALPAVLRAAPAALMVLAAALALWTGAQYARAAFFGGDD